MHIHVRPWYYNICAFQKEGLKRRDVGKKTTGRYVGRRQPYNVVTYNLLTRVTTYQAGICRRRSNDQIEKCHIFDIIL